MRSDADFGSHKFVADDFLDSLKFGGGIGERLGDNEINPFRAEPVEVRRKDILICRAEGNKFRPGRLLPVFAPRKRHLVHKSGK
jgi:hypothetical protein